jgi:hypothetical protein
LAYSGAGNVAPAPVICWAEAKPGAPVTIAHATSVLKTVKRIANLSSRWSLNDPTLGERNDTPVNGA